MPSNVAGYLPQSPGTGPNAQPVPLEGTALENLFQALVVGITQLSGTLVRPRWQPDPPPQPDKLTNWCAIGIVNRQIDANPAIIHQPNQGVPVPPDPDPQGRDLMQRHEKLEVLASFYGPLCQDYAAQLRDGVYVNQNHEALLVYQMAVVGAGDVRAVPELINQEWVNRADLMIVFRREVLRSYQVLNLLKAQGAIETAQYSLNFET